MSIKTSLYVPDRDKEGKDVSSLQREVATYVATRLSSKFGGCSEAVISGYWTTQDERLMQEKTLVLYVVECEELQEEVLALMYELVDYVKDTLNQQCVLMTIEEVAAAHFCY